MSSDSTTVPTAQRVGIPALTFLRFVAAFHVFIFHLQLRWPLAFPVPIEKIISQGAVGMTFFFVLSGFILTYNYAGRNMDGNLSNYYLKRIARIYPVYLLCLLLSLLGYHNGVEPVSSLPNHPWLAVLIPNCLLFLQNIFCIQAWFPQSFDYWNDNGSWSLSVEVFFYFVFPILLKYLEIISSRSMVLFAFIIYFISLLPGLSNFSYGDLPFPVYYASPIYRLPEFIIGIISSLWLFRHPVSVKSASIVVVLSSCIITFYLGIVAPNGWIIHHWIVIPCFTSIIMGAASLKGRWLNNFLSFRPFQILGEFSYSLYMVQLVTIPIAIYYHDVIILKMPLLEERLNWWFFVIMTTVTASLLVWILIETPARKKIVKSFI